MTETLKKGTRVTGADRTKLASDLSENGVSLRGRGGATRGKARAKR